MPIINTGEYNIDFFVLENNDPKSITLIDRSNYLETPKNPKIFIVFPGELIVKESTYTPNSIIVIDSATLGETPLTTGLPLKDFSDGVYHIKMGVCPYDELYKDICWLKTTQFDCKFEELLRSVDENCCNNDNKFNKELINIEILIQSAKAEAAICNIKKATNKYSVALSKLNLLTKSKWCN